MKNKLDLTISFLFKALIFIAIFITATMFYAQSTTPFEQAVIIIIILMLILVLLKDKIKADSKKTTK